MLTMVVEKKKYVENDKKKKKWSSGLRRQTVNLLSFLIVGSNPTFFNYLKSEYSVVW